MVIICACSWTKSDAQTEFNIKIGAETWSWQDEKAQSGRSSHPGQMIGFDMKVGQGLFYFVPGFQYHRISVLNEDNRFSFDFSEAHHMHYFTIPMLCGYSIVDSSSINLSALAGVEANFFYSLDDNDVGLEDDMYYGMTAALSAGLRADFFSWLTAEISYHYGFLPTLKTRDDSKLRGWTIAAGVKF